MQLHDLFEQAIFHKASDLHVLVGKPPILRIDGVLHEIEGLSILGPDDIDNLITQTLNPSQRQQLYDQRELDIAVEMENKIRFRVNLHWERGHLGIAARLIQSRTPTLEEIMMPDVVRMLLDRRQGLILVTGPTGCGKSTSLAAMIDYINATRSENIITLEDPVEFIYESKKSIIRQRQLHQDMLSFAEALKHVVRQDPNVILVGEMRDLETISTTITLAETGHLVLATLHTFNAAQTIDRIVDIFPPHQQDQVRLQLSLFLNGIVSQQLVPKVGDGRIAAREVLISTPAIANLIRENKIQQIRSVLQTSSEYGMVTIDQDLERLFNSGMVSRETAAAYMTNPETLDKNVIDER